MRVWPDREYLTTKNILGLNYKILGAELAVLAVESLGRQE
jgi:hypothetical protein